MTPWIRRWLVPALLAAGPCVAANADQPEKARDHPLDNREPRQEVIEGQSDASRPAADTPVADPPPSSPAWPDDRSDAEAEPSMPGSAADPATRPPGS